MVQPCPFPEGGSVKHIPHVLALLAVACINFKADQTLVGTALNLLGQGTRRLCDIPTPTIVGGDV